MAGDSLDPRLHGVRVALGGNTHVPIEPPDHEADRMEAAVSLVIRARERLEFLLIKRATHDRDPWSGQMALPGGRWEAGDDGLLHTAQRETREETGVDLEAVGAPIGRLDDVIPTNPRLPSMRIAPFVFGVPDDTEAHVASPELQSVHWIPIELLRAPETSSWVKITLPGHRQSFPSFHVVDEHVWGLTHRILTGFLQRYR